MPYRKLVLLTLSVLACSGGGAQSPAEAPTDSGVEAALLPDAAIDAESTIMDSGTDATAVVEAGEAGGPVTLAGVVNVRHTGGLVTSSGLRVRDRMIIRAGTLSTLTAEGCTQLGTLAIRTVIDLRSAAEVAADPDADCVAATATCYNADIPRILPPTETSYLQTLDALELKLGEVFQRLAAPGALPAIIHCVIGRDRASLTTALVLLALGVPEAQVLQDFDVNQEADVDTAWMAGVLARISEAGGIDAYLQAHGVTSTQLVSLRAAALE